MDEETWSETSAPANTSTVSEMVSNVIRTNEAWRASRGAPSDNMAGPLFTFLIGAGFSISAGVPSTRHLVAALEEWEKHREKTFNQVLDDTAETDAQEAADRRTQRYFHLMQKILPNAPARHDFITTVVRWAASRQVQMNPESILLASILVNGIGTKFCLDPQKTALHWLARSFAQHVFTTNFDEVLPTTFHYGNQSAEVIDIPGTGLLRVPAEYPTIVYLHGRHLHYDIRTTPEDLCFEPSEPERWREQLFHTFRDLLKTTGLIVIGYSGAEDLVMKCIEEALDDPAGLPHGLWWAVHRKESSVSDRVRELISKYDRAHYLEPEADAEEIMKLLCGEIGINDLDVTTEWFKHAEKVSKTVSKFLDKASYPLRLLQREAKQAAYILTRDDAEGVLAKWTNLEKSVREHPDKQLAADILRPVGYFMLFVGRVQEGEGLLREALELHRKVGSDLGAANDLKGLGAALLYRDQVDEAEKAYRDALDLHRKVGDDLGAAWDHMGLAEAPLTRGEDDDLDQAEQLISEAKNCLGRAPDKEGELELKRLEGKLAAAQGKKEEARGILKKVVEEATRLGFMLIAHDAKEDLKSLDP